MSQQLIDEITSKYLKSDAPELRPGDTVKVAVKIVEGDKEIRWFVFHNLWRIHK